MVRNTLAEPSGTNKEKVVCYFFYLGNEMRFIYIIIILVYQPAEVRYAVWDSFCHNAFILLGWMQS